jgi:hypothetical protein
MGYAMADLQTLDLILFAVGTFAAALVTGVAGFAGRLVFTPAPANTKTPGGRLMMHRRSQSASIFRLVWTNVFSLAEQNAFVEHDAAAPTVLRTASWSVSWSAGFNIIQGPLAAHSSLNDDMRPRWTNLL